MKIKVGRDKLADPARVELVQSVVGPNVEVMVDGNGAYTQQEALLWGECFRDQGVRYFEEPLSSEDLDGLSEFLCASLESRIERRVRRSCKIQEGHTLCAEGSPRCAAPNALVRAALGNSKTWVGCAPGHRSSCVERK